MISRARGTEPAGQGGAGGDSGPIRGLPSEAPETSIAIAATKSGRAAARVSSVSQRKHRARESSAVGRSRHAAYGPFSAIDEWVKTRYRLSG
jgi:hypothetical protein